ncbi:MAG: Na/Pi symporter [Taibaiella sp.]|nr:Na/Pi symporter [Taibaiella sp.]
MADMNWWQLFAGVAVFIFAMSLLEDSLKNLAGRPFKKFLQRQTSHKLRAIVAGTFVTAVLQSSSVVLLMVLSFVGAGVMSMRNAMAVSFGANLGTTVSSWVVALLGFKIELDAIAYPILVVFLLIKILLPSNNNMKYLTHFIMGFSLLFIGLEWMKTSVSGIVDASFITRFADLSPYLFIIAGLLITAVIQSSSATMAITLTALHGSIIPFESAACVVIGSELGTTLKILIGAWSGDTDKKRVAVGNVIFNIVITILSTIFLFPLIHLIRNVMSMADPLIALVAFQSFINCGTIIIFYPFIEHFGTYLENLFKTGEKVSSIKYINLEEKQFTKEMLGLTEKETVRLLQHTIRLNSKILGLDDVEHQDESWLVNIKKFAFEPISADKGYITLKQLHGDILKFLVGIDKEEMKPEEIEQLGKLITTTRSIMRAAKNMKDIEHNIKEVAASANDTFNELLIQLREQETMFYKALQKLLPNDAKTGSTIDLEQLQLQNKTGQELSVSDTLVLLNKGLITDVDSSTLLNVYREIYSAHKALLTAVANLREMHTAE